MPSSSAWWRPARIISWADRTSSSAAATQYVEYFFVFSSITPLFITFYWLEKFNLGDLVILGLCYDTFAYVYVVKVRYVVSGVILYLLLLTSAAHLSTSLIRLIGTDYKL